MTLTSGGCLKLILNEAVQLTTRWRCYHSFLKQDNYRRRIPFSRYSESFVVRLIILIQLRCVFFTVHCHIRGICRRDIFIFFNPAQHFAETPGTDWFWCFPLSIAIAHLVRVWCVLWIQMSWNVIQVHYWIADLKSQNRAGCRALTIQHEKEKELHFSK